MTAAAQQLLFEPREDGEDAVVVVHTPEAPAAGESAGAPNRGAGVPAAQAATTRDVATLGARAPHPELQAERAKWRIGDTRDAHNACPACGRDRIERLAEIAASGLQTWDVLCVWPRCSRARTGATR